MFCWNNYPAFYIFTNCPPRSNAGVRSTSFGITLLYIKLYIPQLISFSVIGGGSAKGLFLIWAGKILLCFLAMTLKIDLISFIIYWF